MPVLAAEIRTNSALLALHAHSFLAPLTSVAPIRTLQRFRPSFLHSIVASSVAQYPFDLSRFSLADMTRCGTNLRQLGVGAGSMEEVASRTVRFLHSNLVSADGIRACALVRMFVTMPFAALEKAQQDFALRILGSEPARPDMKCLTLLATTGDEAAWNSRHTSTGHVALPLPSAESVARAPMIAQLLRQLGVELGTFLSPRGPVVIDTEQHTFNVFHVLDAQGSPYIPAQREFVEPFGVRSVLGFGGLLPSGSLFATILFTRIRVSRDVAELFQTLALNVKVALLPYSAGPVFR